MKQLPSRSSSPALLPTAGAPGGNAGGGHHPQQAGAAAKGLWGAVVDAVRFANSTDKEREKALERELQRQQQQQSTPASIGSPASATSLLGSLVGASNSTPRTLSPMPADSVAPANKQQQRRRPTGAAESLAIQLRRARRAGRVCIGFSIVLSFVFTMCFAVLLVISPETAAYVPVLGAAVPQRFVAPESAMGSRQRSGAMSRAKSMEVLKELINRVRSGRGNANHHNAKNYNDGDDDLYADDLYGYGAKPRGAVPAPNLAAGGAAAVAAAADPAAKSLLSSSSQSSQAHAFGEEALLDFASHSLWDGTVGRRSLRRALRSVHRRRAHDALLYGVGARDRSVKGDPHPEVQQTYADGLAPKIGREAAEALADQRIYGRAGGFRPAPTSVDLNNDAHLFLDGNNGRMISEEVPVAGEGAAAAADAKKKKEKMAGARPAVNDDDHDAAAMRNADEQHHRAMAMAMAAVPIAGAAAAMGAAAAAAAAGGGGDGAVSGGGAFDSLYGGRGGRPPRLSGIRDNGRSGLGAYRPPFAGALGTGPAVMMSSASRALDGFSFATDTMPSAYGKPWAAREMFHDDASFYIAIAQFKDVLCPFTLHEIYEKARNPRRVFAGIVDQRENSSYVNPNGVGAPQPISVIDPNDLKTPYMDATCFPWYMLRTCATTAFCPTDNLRVRRAYPHEGKGPTWGRYYGMLMYQGESYYMMIDSHSRFTHHWEAHIMNNLFQVEKETNGRAVLSHYPPSHVRYEQLLSHRTQTTQMVMCAAHYQTSGIIRMDSVNVQMKGRPVLQPFSAAGFVAGDAQFVHEVPFDPYLTFVFDGEEILYSVRLWTAGYNLYTPMSSILFHNYDRHDAPRFWTALPEADWKTQQYFGRMRVRYIMRAFNNQTRTYGVSDEHAEKYGARREIETYGLGKARPLDDYYKFANIDPSAWTINDGDIRCKRYRRDERYRKYHIKTPEMFDEEDRLAEVAMAEYKERERVRLAEEAEAAKRQAAAEQMLIQQQRQHLALQQQQQQQSAQQQQMAQQQQLQQQQQQQLQQQQWAQQQQLQQQRMAQQQQQQLPPQHQQKQQQQTASQQQQQELALQHQRVALQQQQQQLAQKQQRGGNEAAGQREHEAVARQRQLQAQLLQQGQQQQQAFQQGQQQEMQQ